jgi:hypothetical protein
MPTGTTLPTTAKSTARARFDSRLIHTYIGAEKQPLTA